MTGGVECVWPLAAELGEGPVWVARESALWFVDIKGHKVHRFHPASGAAQSFDAPDQVGFVMPLATGGFLAGLKSGLHFFDPVSGRFKKILEVHPEHPGNRLNDAGVDTQGRLWFGSMDDDEEACSGALYRLDADGRARIHDEGYCITNGPCASPDGAVFYHTDTVKKTIYAFDLTADGALSRKRVFARIEDNAGWPDGTSIDCEGCVWVALFGGGGVRRYAPDGHLLSFVALPCPNVTKIAFGGADLRTVFVTTARKGMSRAARAAHPLAGGLFRFRTAVPGIAPQPVRVGVQDFR
jgi:sugar lactone lactonase YvrE